METLLPDGGFMGELIRNHRWEDTVFGPLASWPQSLLTPLSVALSSKFPIIIFWGPQFGVLYNDAYAPTLGGRHPWALGKTGIEAWGEIWEIIHPLFEKVFRGQATWSDDQLSSVTRNGFLEESYMTWSFSPIRYEDGTVGGVFAPVTETTARVLGERRLKTLRELGSKSITAHTIEAACDTAMETFAQNCADVTFAIIYLLDKNRSVYVFQSCFGVKKGDAIAPLEAEIVNGIWPFEDASQPGQRCLEVDVSHFRNLPGGIWPEPSTKAVMVPLSIDHDSIGGIFIMGINPRRRIDEDYLTFIDLISSQTVNSISTAKSYQEEKKRAEALAEIDRAKTAFFSNVSHEFRTPLTLILGPLEDSLSDQVHPLSKAQRERQIIIHRNSLRLLKLVNTLLDFSRIEAGRARAYFEPVNLAPLTLELAEIFRPAMEKGNLKYTVEMEDVKQEVYVDRDMWEKIVFNLLSNALKYTTEGEVKISVKPQEKFAELIVQDTGIGIEEEELPKIFERFHRIDGANGRSHEGTGIGLALINELVKLHGGSIQVESEYSKGSRFRILIPLGSKHIPEHLLTNIIQSTKPVGALGTGYVEEALRWLGSPQEEYINRQQTMDDQKHDVFIDRLKDTILLVDDNADMRDYVFSILKNLWHVEVATNGIEALELIKSKGPPALILSDVMMPKMDGFQLIAALRQEKATKLIPVILLSARAGEEARIEGLSAGADDYLVKPFSAKELVARVNTHLELSRLRVELEHQVEERTKELIQVNKDLEVQITERNVAEIALRQSEQRYMTLARVSPVGIFYTDPQGKTSYLNERWHEITRYPVSDTKEQGWMTGIHVKDIKRIQQSWQKAVVDRQAFVGEYRYKRPDGMTVWTLGQALPDVDSQGKVRGFVGSVTDISERKRLEKEKVIALKSAEMEQRHRAQEANEHQRHLEHFIDMICHETRNPLNGIFNNVDLLKNGIAKRRILVESLRRTRWYDSLSHQIALDDEAIEAIDICARQQKIISDDVLNLSRLEAHQIILKKNVFSPKEVMMEAVKMFSAELKAKSIEIYTKFPSEDVFVMGDHPRLLQVVTNLLSNSIKFTSRSQTKKITLSMKVLSREDKFVTLEMSIKDSGVGMTPDEQKALFERFAQGSNKTYQEYGGSGLGLFICKGLVRLMDGQISLSSEKWQGTTFIFTIRCEAVDSNQKIDAKVGSGETGPSAKPIDFSKLKVLIVEDNLVNQKVLKRQLDSIGVESHIASNGLEAVQQFSKNKYDLVFMDVEMPVMDGLEATQTIRAQELANTSLGHTPIVGLSGNARQVEFSS
eukprot:TRINITY_DN1142_c2_g1_i4.p1 TRINITY_DN1142_c2_g1~~TRINITY_DN1142_c2_g1_i4.p1  ORF type:complete len:1304 (-),score=421.96 TRINITY_DN1142_c2_g1_i4:247-4158(-)